MNEQDIIEAENQELAKGATPQALISDDHLKHARAHWSTGTEGALEHIHEHYSIYFSVPLSEVRADALYSKRLAAMLGLEFH